MSTKKDLSKAETTTNWKVWNYRSSRGYLLIFRNLWSSAIPNNAELFVGGKECCRLECTEIAGFKRLLTYSNEPCGIEQRPRVLTTEQLHELYKTELNNIGVNLKVNKDRYF